MPISRKSTPEELIQHLAENNIILPTGAKVSITDISGVMIIGRYRCGNIEHVDNIQIVDKDGQIIDNLWTCSACERPFPSAKKTKDECCSETCRKYKSSNIRDRDNFYSLDCDFCKKHLFHGDLSIILDEDNNVLLSCDICIVSHPPKRILINAYANNNEPGILDDFDNDNSDDHNTKYSSPWNKSNDHDNQNDYVPNYHDQYDHDHDDEYDEYMRHSKPWSKFDDSNYDEDKYHCPPLYKSHREHFGSNDYFNDN